MNLIRNMKVREQHPNCISLLWKYCMRINYVVLPQRILRISKKHQSSVLGSEKLLKFTGTCLAWCKWACMHMDAYTHFLHVCPCSIGNHHNIITRNFYGADVNGWSSKIKEWHSSFHFSYPQLWCLELIVRVPGATCGVQYHIQS